jgi:hypothetical protein
LDNAANTVNEQHVLDALEAASDNDRGVERLDESSKAVVKKLKEWVGDLVRAIGNK